MSIKEIKILNMLLTRDKTTPLKSASIVGMLSAIKDTKYSMSESTLRRYVSKLLKEEYIAYGIKNEQEKKYYITQKGINLIKEMTGGDLDE